MWPNLIVQQQSNTLAMRQIVPLDPHNFDLVWTFFGYADDPPEMRQRRLRQANLIGPAGLVSIDDSEAMLLSQAGIAGNDERDCVVEMGGREVADAPTMVTETLIRGIVPALPRGHGAVGRHDLPPLRVSTRRSNCARASPISMAPMTMRSTSGNGSAGPSSSPKTAVYKVLPRENVEQGLPVAMVYCESRAMLADRVVALREALVFAPRLIRRITGAPCLRQIGPDGMRLHSSFALFETMLNEPSTLFLCGRIYDRVVEDAARAALRRAHRRHRRHERTALADLSDLTVGSIRFQGSEIAGAPPHRIINSGIGRTFQIPRPFRRLTLFDNVVLAGFTARDATRAPAPTRRRNGLSLWSDCRSTAICRSRGLAPPG